MTYFLLIFAVLIAIGSAIAIKVGTKNGRSGLTITWIGIILLVTDAALTACYLMGLIIPLLVVFGLFGSFALAMGISVEDNEAKEKQNVKIEDRKKDFLSDVKTSHIYGGVGLFFYLLTAILWYQQSWFQSLATVSFSIICIILICEFVHPSKKKFLNLSSITTILLGLLIIFLNTTYHLDMPKIMIVGFLGSLVIYALRLLGEYLYKKYPGVNQQITPYNWSYLVFLS